MRYLEIIKATDALLILTIAQIIFDKMGVSKILKVHEEARVRIERNQLQWRRRFLNKFDVCCFNKVPPHIVRSFFGEGTYRTRLFVSTFGYVNGIHPEALLRMVQWKPFKGSDGIKIFALYKYWDDDREKAAKYYSYNTIKNIMMFCNGDIRVNQQRKITEHL